MLRTTALIAGSLMLGTASLAVAEPTQQLAQAQMQNQSQIDQDYQQLMRAAKTPEERARIQRDYERAQQQGAVPDSGTNVQTAPGTAGSGTRPSTSPSMNNPGQSPTGGGARPPGQ